MHKTGATKLLSRMNPLSQNDGLKLCQTAQKSCQEVATENGRCINST